jgi:hypothetical protein
MSRPPVAAPRIHQATKRLGPETIAALVADYQAGFPGTALMTKYGLGKGTVLDLLHQAGVKLRAQGRRNIDLVEATQLYEAGWSLVRLADTYDCDAETVRKALREAGVKMRPRRGGPRRC